MPRRRRKSINDFEKSLQLWPLLVLAARNRQTLTYGMVEKMTGINHHVGLPEPLGNIYYYCKYKGLPLLNLLVVNEETGKQSAKSFEGLDIPKEHTRIFNFDNFDWDKWVDHIPSLAALEEAQRKGDAEKAAA